MYACGYPIYHTVTFTDEGYTNYSITLEGKQIYAGRVYPYASGGSVDVDISAVCREHLDTSFEEFPTLSGTSAGAVGVFNVDGKTYQVCYNYNTDYNLEIESGKILNAPLTDYVDLRQYIGTSTLTGSGITANHARPTGAVGDTITVGGFDFNILPECKSRYALYYVNKEGGLDYLVCNGKSTDKYNAKRTDGRFYTNHTNRALFSNSRINQYISKQYQLNTGFISQERARNIDHLIYSPKVWIHNLQEDTITACTVDDNAYSAKTFRNNGLINYTINVTESQYLIRK